MLQISVVRETKDQVISGLKKRGLADAGDRINTALAMDDVRKELQAKQDDILAKANALARDIGSLMKAGKREDAEKLKVETGALKEAAADYGKKLAEANDTLRAFLLTIPNVPHADVPAGTRAEDNKKVLEEGISTQLGTGALPHWDLIKKYDIIDFELGNKITGAGFPVYKGAGAKLQRALINFFLDEAIQAGYIEIQPPLLVNEASGYGTGQLPDKEGQMYHVNDDNLYLIPTAEVPITNLYRDVILAESDLPIKNVGYTPCFRREAGSWGAHVRGLNRVHQFDKVEIVQIVHPEGSYRVLDEMCSHVEGLRRKLELPFRKMLLCGGDMGFNASTTYDMEVFAAAQQRWLEVSSISNFETYQANRMKLRCKMDGKAQLLHTLNGSALALPRIVAALLENNQTPKGIEIPKALIPYTGFKVIN
jgi:seryl-tRNA synthetase